MNLQWLTDEQLASFLDCSTNEEGMRRVLQSLQTDATLREALTVALQSDENAQCQSSSTLHPQPSALPLIPLLRLAADKGELPAAADILQAKVDELNAAGLDGDGAVEWLKANSLKYFNK